MDKKRLEYYKKKLAIRREELMKTIARTQEEGRTADEDPTVDLADKAANSYTKEFLFGMTNTDRTILNMIDAALKRINTDDYGVCANCQEELQQKRLAAVPWAKHCITCQETMEKSLLSSLRILRGKSGQPRGAGRIHLTDPLAITYLNVHSPFHYKARESRFLGARTLPCTCRRVSRGVCANGLRKPATPSSAFSFRQVAGFATT